MKRRRPMTQQKSEDCIVPKGPRKLASTRATEGGKAVPVKGAGQQGLLPFATAENSWQREAERKLRPGRPGGGVHKVPKAKVNQPPEGPAKMEEVVERLTEALYKVVANKGAPGPDRQTVTQLAENWSAVYPRLRRALMNGNYAPGEIRRAWIPKSDGKGERGLGIPSVIDRVVQEATRMVLEPRYEPKFNDASHGFRPKRGCHTAIAQAKKFVQEGCHWVVDIDLESFFVRVPHQRLMAKLAEQVEDRRLLVLIHRMLKAKVVMPDGVRVATEEGLPQGGPLSPLLSNIVLNELDVELARRGLHFVRYADDCNVYVHSERAAQRVMRSTVQFIERRLGLKVNMAKSAAARPETRHFLGYRLAPKSNGKVQVLLSERSEKRLKERVVELTPRNAGRSLQATIDKINLYLRGWLGHFGVCTNGIKSKIGAIDAHIRRRLRACLLKHWKTKRTIARRLIGLGVKRKTAWRRVYEGRKSIWNLSHNSAVNRGLRNAYFAERGLVSLLDQFTRRWAIIFVPKQLTLF